MIVSFSVPTVPILWAGGPMFATTSRMKGQLHVCGSFKVRPVVLRVFVSMCIRVQIEWRADHYGIKESRRPEGEIHRRRN